MTVIVIEQFDETSPVIASYSTHFPTVVKIGSAVIGKNFEDVIGSEIFMIHSSSFKVFLTFHITFDLSW